MRRMRYKGTMIAVLVLLALLVSVAAAATPSNVVVDGNSATFSGEWPADSYVMDDGDESNIPDQNIPDQYDIRDVYSTENTAGTYHFIRYETGANLLVNTRATTYVYYDLDNISTTGRSEVCDVGSIGAEMRVTFGMDDDTCVIHQWAGTWTKVSNDCNGEPWGEEPPKSDTTVEIGANATDVGLSGGLIAVKIFFENNDSSGPADDIVCFTYGENGGGEGCTPGYWKQSQHFDSWVTPPYYPNSTYFNEVFGVGPHVTLLEALGTGGGGENALGRHAVAALLNAAANSGVDYLYTTDDVIQMVKDAYATGDFEGIKNLFADENELGCPLD